MSEHGDENGLMWTTAPVVTQRSRGQKRPPRKPPAPEWDPPTIGSMFKDEERISLDIETVDPDLLSKGPGVRRDGYIVGVGIGSPNHGAKYYPLAHADGPNVDSEKFFSWLRLNSENFEGEIVGANLNYDLDYLAEQGVKFPKAKIRDVQIAEPLLNERRQSYSLNALSEIHLEQEKVTDELKQLYGDDYIKRMNDIHPGHVAKYVEGDLRLPWQIFAKQEKLIKEKGVWELFELESRLVPMLLHMRRVGVRVDHEKASQVLQDMTSKAKELQDSLPRPVDVWSAHSVAAAMDAVGIKYEVTAAGNPSFRRTWLERHSDPLPRKIAEIRAIEKLSGTFIGGYILGNQVNGRLHCQFNQLRGNSYGTVSGRFSSSNPNLQNIPARDPELGPLMRSIFIPEEDQLWGCVDWSQIEFRLLVHWAIAHGLKSAIPAAKMYRDDPSTDFHAMAAELTGLERSPSKAINFGVVYGMGEETMAANLDKPLDEARVILNKFHQRLPFIKEISELESRAAKRDGYITTILNRYRHYPNGEGAYAALNGKLQGSAADLMKKAMVDMWDSGILDVLTPHLTVHDEMDVSIPDTKAGEEAWQELQDIMRTALDLHVPILVDANTGKNWSEAK